MRKISAPLSVGLAAGIAFFLHAMIPNSNAWPLLWPAAAGVVGVLLASRSGSELGFWGNIGIGLKSGAVAGAVFFVATAVSLLILSSPGLTSTARQMGAEGPINVTVVVLMGLALAAAVGMALSALSAGAAYPLLRSRE